MSTATKRIVNLSIMALFALGLGLLLAAIVVWGGGPRIDTTNATPILGPGTLLVWLLFVEQVTEDADRADGGRATHAAKVESEGDPA